MTCDGKNSNCDRRRELLQQLKCLIVSMERRNPCEWDENPSSAVQPVCFKSQSLANNCGAPLKCAKSYEFRASLFYKCECIKRNGLQDRCFIMDCMGRPECMTKLYPVCCPGQRALVKLTDFGDEELALRNYYKADQNRNAALEHLCKLKCNPVPSCSPNNTCLPQLCPPKCLPPCPPPPCPPKCLPPCPPPPCPPKCLPPCPPQSQKPCPMPCPQVCFFPCPPKCPPPCPPPCSVPKLSPCMMKTSSCPQPEKPCPMPCPQVCFFPCPPKCLPPCPPPCPPPQKSCQKPEPAKCSAYFPSNVQFCFVPCPPQTKLDKEYPSQCPPQVPAPCPKVYLMCASPPTPNCPSPLSICAQ